MSSSRPYTFSDSPNDPLATGGPLSSPPPLQPLYPVMSTTSNRSLPSLPTELNHTKPVAHRSQSSQTVPLTHRSEPGSSSNNPIDLTSSPPRPQHSLPPPPPPPPPPPRLDARSGPVPGTSSSAAPSRRRSSGYVTTVVPEWQPDQSVKACPLCHTQFTMFFRKHHCRICGRVVCASCSPHRITVPSSITVKPPNERPAETFPAQQALQGIANNANFSTRTSWYSGGPLLSPALDGPEEVRMCDECMKDPFVHNRTIMGSSSSTARGIPNSTTNYGNSQAPSTGIPGGGRGRRRAIPEQSGRSVPPNYQPNGLSFLTQPPSLTAAPYSNSPYGDPTAYYWDAGSTSGPNGGGLSSALATSQGNAFSLALPQGMQNSAAPFPNMYLPHPPNMFTQPLQPPQQVPQRLNSRRNFSYPHGHLPYPASQSPLPPIPVQDTSSGNITNPPHARSQPQRPQLKETDFCPICTQALPPPDPTTGSEAARERHIEACIEATMSGTSSTPPQQQQQQQHASMSTSAPNATGPARPANMPRRSTVSTKIALRMSTYKATEKDTHNEDGEAVECVICFEEFEKGDEMAMLDCLCRYHKACIRQWFDKKGNGNCPVHSSGES